jgi:hypothetical protein
MRKPRKCDEITGNGTALSCSVPAETEGALPASTCPDLGLRRPQNTMASPSTRSPQQKRRWCERQCCPDSRGPEVANTMPDRGVCVGVVQASAALLFLPQIRRPDFAVVCRRAVGMGFHVPESKIANVAPRLAILEGHQHWQHWNHSVGAGVNSCFLPGALKS